MGFDCGFDIYQPLAPTPANQDKYQRFIAEIMQTYANSSDCHANDSERVADLIPKAHGALLEFKVGEHPTLPYNPHLCHYLVRFSSEVSGRLTAPAESYLEGVYKVAARRFRKRVKWWHELNEWTWDLRDAYGYYDWREVHRVKEKL